MAAHVTESQLFCPRAGVHLLFVEMVNQEFIENASATRAQAAADGLEPAVRREDDSGDDAEDAGSPAARAESLRSATPKAPTVVLHHSQTRGRQPSLQPRHGPPPHGHAPPQFMGNCTDGNKGGNMK